MRIEVGVKEGIRDILGERVKKEFPKARKIRAIDVYSMDGRLSRRELDFLGKQVFSDPVVNVVAPNVNLKGFDWGIEVGFLPGVTDNVGKTAKEAVEEALGKKIRSAHYSRLYAIKGRLGRKEIEGISMGLHNGLIERAMIYGKRKLRERRDPYIPKVSLKGGGRVETIALNVSDDELMKISNERLLALNLGEMKRIRYYFSGQKTVRGRKRYGLNGPTDVELEAIAQTWSEHCKHKIFNSIIDYGGGGKRERIDSLFRTFIKKTAGKRNDLVSVFKDNAGIVRFDEKNNLAVKVETHNAPSALDPYGGALTGILGVNRDVMGAGLGAKPVANLDVFCFAPPDYKGPVPKNLFHPKRTFEGVRKGVQDGGNKSGIPTVNGSIYFDERFLRPLVFCGTVGIMPARVKGRPTHVKSVRPGDLIVMAGGRIGMDGIHGATFSSRALDENSPASAVQLGDPITQKKMLDFLIDARDKGLYWAITDNGAGGLSSSVGEMAQLCGGFELHLDRAPMKYAGLKPWEILLSESQERMTLAVGKKNTGRLKELARKHGVEISVLGRFVREKKFHVLYKGKTVALMEMEFVHSAPRMHLKAQWKEPSLAEPRIRVNDLTKDLLAILSRPNVCSKESVVRQYDHEVQGGSAVKPLVGFDGPSDAAVVRPLLGSREGVVVAHGICPKYSDIDAYWMACNSMDEAVRNAVSVGADPGKLYGLDNFCWSDPIRSESNPDGMYKLAQLVRACKGLYDYSKTLGIPCVSGKDSMKNDYIMGKRKISIPPTLLFTVVGKVEDAGKCVTMDVKTPGDLVYVVGITRDEMGGSEYYYMKGSVGKNVPRVDFKVAKRIYDSIHRSVSSGLIESCHDCSQGGLGVALAESALAGGLGMGCELSEVKATMKEPWKVLFSESASRFVVTVRPENKGTFERVMGKGLVSKIGFVRGDDLFALKWKGREIVKGGIGMMKKAWKGGLI